MASGDVIREFLVRLGFDPDEANLRKFTTAIAAGERSAKTFGRELKVLSEGIVGLGVAVTAAVAILANRFEQLYYVSQRTGVSAQNILKFKFAAEQVGLSAEEAQGQLESFAASVRSNPALRNFAQMIAPGAKDAAEQLRAFARAYKEASQRGPYGEALFRAQLEALGMSPEFVRQLSVNYEVAEKEAARLEQIYRKVGRSIQEVTENAVRYAREQRALGAQISSVWDAFVVTLFPTFERIVIRINKWLEDNSEKIKKTADDFADWLDRGNGLDKMANGLEAVGKALGTIVDLLKWCAENEGIVAYVLGTAAGARVGGLPGALIGGPAALAAVRYGQGKGPGQKDYNEQNWDPAWGPYKENERLIPQILDWINGKKQTPWVKVERDDQDSEERSIWARLREWLSGTGSVAPFVRLDRDGPGGANGLPGGEGAGSSSAPGGASGPSSKGGSDSYDLSGGSGNTNTDAALSMIERYESKGRNVMNYINDRTHTAGGYYQITNSTWRGIAKAAGVDLGQYPTAISAPKNIQRMAAAALFRRGGFRDWAPYNANLRAALARGDLQKLTAQMAGAQAGTAVAAAGGTAPAGGGYDPQHLAYWKYNKEHPNAMKSYDDWLKTDAPGSTTPGMSYSIGKPVGVSQSNTFHIHGSEPSQVALLVQRSQSRLNSDLYRNTADSLA